MKKDNTQKKPKAMEMRNCKICGSTFLAMTGARGAVMCQKCTKKIDNIKFQKTIAYRTALLKYRASRKYKQWYEENHPFVENGEKNFICTQCGQIFIGMAFRKGTICKKCVDKNYRHKPNIKAAKRKYNLEYWKTDTYKEKRKKYAASEKGKAAMRRYWQSEKGKAARLRGALKRKEARNGK